MNDREEICEEEDCDLSDKQREREAGVQEIFHLLDASIEKLTTKIKHRKSKKRR